tara:strand:- start:5608 stop:6459 length:852 start_codon:yes stop_codon:yes gene_type:complete
MKFVIDNYADYNSSQPMYFNNHIDELEEHSCMMINQQSMSIYDLFDRTQPDCYITSSNKFSKDALAYLEENKNIKLILCVSNAKNSQVLELEDILLEHEINCPFFITNVMDGHIPFTKKIKILRVYEATDLNLDNDIGVDYKIDKAVVVVEGIEKIRKYNSTFHVMSSNVDIAKSVDVVLPIHMMKAAFGKYDEIIFQNFNRCVPQAFFESLALGKKTYYDLQDKDQANAMDKLSDKFFGVGNKLNYSKPDKLEDFTDVAKRVLEKHTSVNRVKTLISQIPKK